MSDKMSEVDWENDEAVVRAAHPLAFVPKNYVWSSNDGRTSICLGKGWSESRQYPTVVAFERENRPVSEVEAAKKAVLDSRVCAKCGEAVYYDNGDCTFGCLCFVGWAWKSKWDAASKLTPAAVAGDATQCSVCNHALHEGACNAAMDCLCVQYPSLRGVKVADPVGEREGDKQIGVVDGVAMRLNGVTVTYLGGVQVQAVCGCGWMIRSDSHYEVHMRAAEHTPCSRKVWNAALAAKPSAEGIPKERFYLGQQERDALEATISSKEEEIARLSELLEIEAKLSDKRAGKWLKEFDRAQAAEAELSALKLSSARIEEETLWKAAGIHVPDSLRPLSALAAIMWMREQILSLIPTSPESQKEGE